MKAFVLLANGCEETEAIGTIDLLRRADIEVTTLSITDTLRVEGAHGIVIEADRLLTDVLNEVADAIVLPGGMPGASNLAASEPLRTLLLRHHAEGKVLAAICAAPLVLGQHGLLKGVKSTCYPSFESQLTGATVVSDGVVTDGRIITGRGPAYVFDFALAIISRLLSPATADAVAKGLLWRE